MDWEKVIADEERILDRHYTPGRSQKIDKIVLHHNAGNLSIADCYRVWQTREASAHYQVDSSGRVGQLVNDWDTAWHAGNANPSSIGIEHANDRMGPWTISEAALDAGAHLVAALCKMYGLGEPRWLVNVYPHSHFMATSCPGEIAGSQNAAYMERARYWYGRMTGAGEPAPEQGPHQESGDPVNDAGFLYRAHVADLGWLDTVRDGQTAGTVGYGLRLEAIKITPPEGMVLDVKFHVENVGWRTYGGIERGASSGTGSSDNDPIIGTVGESLQAEALEVVVAENPTGKTLYYRVHLADVGWTGWVEAGYAAGTVGIGKQIEAVQFKLA